MSRKQVTKEEFEKLSKLDEIYFQESLVINQNNGKWMENMYNKNNPYKYMDGIPFFNSGLFILAEQETTRDEWINNTHIQETKTKWFWDEESFEIHKQAYNWAKQNGLDH